jgi:hypothetical protein
MLGEKAPIPIFQQAGQTPEPVWTMYRRENCLVLIGNQTTLYITIGIVNIQIQNSFILTNEIQHKTENINEIDLSVLSSSFAYPVSHTRSTDSFMSDLKSGQSRSEWCHKVSFSMPLSIFAMQHFLNDHSTVPPVMPKPIL